MELSIFDLKPWLFIRGTDKVSFVVRKGDSNLYFQIIGDQSIHALKRAV